RRIKLLFDLSQRQAAIGIAHRKVEFRRQDIAVARSSLERRAEKGLGGAAAVVVGRVDELEALVERLVEAGPRPVRLDPDAVGQPRTERNFGNFEVAVAEP